jgi:prolyl-tRNA synthetase
MHVKNVNYPRDFKADIVADIALANADDQCSKCNGTLKSLNGIEVGHVFKLGTFLSEKLGAYYLDRNGVSRPIIMGSYGIGVGRLLAAAVEQNHDEKGIIWPLPIAPFEVCLCGLRLEDSAVSQKAEAIYQALTGKGIDVLFDDRIESPGVKFNDADLIGIPLRITVSPRTLQSNSVEAKWRKEKQAQMLPLDGIADIVTSMLSDAAQKQHID